MLQLKWERWLECHTKIEAKSDNSWIQAYSFWSLWSTRSAASLVSQSLNYYHECCVLSKDDLSLKSKSQSECKVCCKKIYHTSSRRPERALCMLVTVSEAVGKISLSLAYHSIWLPSCASQCWWYNFLKIRSHSKWVLENPYEALRSDLPSSV